MKKLSAAQRLWRVFVVFAGVAVAVFFTFAAWHGLAIGTPCFFRSYLGVPCLMCGGTRAFFALVQFRFSDAWYFNPLVFPVVLAAASAGVLWFAEAICGRFLLCSAPRWCSRLLRQPLFIPIFLVGLFLVWIRRVADAVTSPKPELLKERGFVLKLFRP